MEMRFRFLDPNNKREKLSMPFVVDFNDGETKGEADSPAGIVALIIGPEYADILDEEVAWHARTEVMEWHALWLAGLDVETAVVDGSVPRPVFSTAPPGEEPEVELRVDGDWVMAASLHNAGLITIYEREDSDVFRGGPAPATCQECRYYNPGEKRCDQFGVLLSDGPSHGCLDGAGKLNGGARPKYVQVGRIEIPPERVKSLRVPAA